MEESFTGLGCGEDWTAIKLMTGHKPLETTWRALNVGC